MRALSFWIILSLLLPPIPAYSSIFPDVPDGHIYREAIERLVGVQVINGHPDGTFRPGDLVNRAATLKMLYRASGKVPDPSHVACFPDVERESWYEGFVCDAAANRYVQGYSDGMFRPDRSVTRAEAIKMITTVLGIEVSELTAIHREVLKFADVSTAAWYTKYLSAAFMKGILPIPGQGGPYFYPDRPLFRGEAAAYLQSALDVKIAEEREEVEEELVLEEQEREVEEQRIELEKKPVKPPPEPPSASRIIDISFPFTDSQTFQEKASISYRFTLQAPTAVAVTVSLKTTEGKISCRLYRLSESGFSLEYYLGYQEERMCFLVTALLPGNYQLQLQPTGANAEFLVTAKAGTGDGNDGFSQAKSLAIGNLRTEGLDGGDLEDWFKFKLTTESVLTLKVTSSANLRCLIYPMEDVDLFGFSGPQCGESYKYPSGTYYIGVGHASPRSARQTYTIQLR